MLTVVTSPGTRHVVTVHISRSDARHCPPCRCASSPSSLTVCAAVLAINLDTTIVNVALPTLADDLDAGTRELQWIVDGYNLAFAALVLAAGSLSDRFGRRPALILGLLGFAGASIVGALVDTRRRPDRLALRDGRVRRPHLPDDAVDHQQHLPRPAGARGRPGRLGSRGRPRRRRRPGHRRPAARALRLGERLLGAGPARPGRGRGGVRRWCPSRATRRCPPLDLPGLGLSVAVLGTLTCTIIEAPEHGWSSARRRSPASPLPRPLLLVVRASSSAAVAHPMLDVTLFRDRRFSAASGAVTVTFFALFGFIFLITQYFQFVRDYGPLSTGARILPVAVSIAVASVVGALLAPRIGTKVVVTTGLLLFGSAFLWISTVRSTRRTPP